MSVTSYNPLISKSFKLFIDKIPSVTFLCTEVELPAFTGNAIEYNTPAGVPMKFADYNAGVYGEFTINFNVDENLDNFIELKTWMDGIYDEFDARSALINIRTSNQFIAHSAIESDGSLTMYDNVGEPSRIFMLRDMFPISISGLSLSVQEQATTTPISVVATFAIRKYEIEKSV